jgi:hypothetical protein
MTVGGIDTCNHVPLAGIVDDDVAGDEELDGASLFRRFTSRCE